MVPYADHPDFMNCAECRYCALPDDGVPCVECRADEGRQEWAPRAPTTGIKFDQDKPRMDLLDPYAIEQLAQVLTFGARKYSAHNWRQGLSKTRLIAAALRHLFAYLRGEDRDPESGLSHAAHAMCCLMFILGLEHRADLDDRYREPA